MKKTILLALLLTLLLTVFVACDSSANQNHPSHTDPAVAETEHRHSWGRWEIIQKATCTENGMRERTCSCGAQETQDITASHTSDAKATCTEAKFCTICNAELTPALGHTPGAEATCTTAQTCTACGIEMVPALGHTPGAEATCTTAQTCTVCGTEMVPASGHLLDAWRDTQEPTLTHNGKKCRECVNCDYKVTEVIIPERFFVDAENRDQIGFTGKAGEQLVIPALFKADDGTWYKVERISENAFEWCSELASVVIPESVQLIGYDAFRNCTGLSSVVIPGSVEDINNDAFAGCSSLISVTISEGVLEISDGAFENCTSLTNISLPNGLSCIGEQAFAYCSSLANIEIPDSVVFIGHRAFMGCGSLEAITLPVIVQYGYDRSDYYPLGALFGTEKYTNGVATQQVRIYYDSTTSYTYYIPASLKSVTITGREIGPNAFENCNGLTSITIGKGVTSIGTDAFKGCSGLECVYITDVVAWCNIDMCDSSSNPLSYVKSLYVNGECVTDLIIPDGVTKIGQYAFYDCKSLTSITIPDSVTSIGMGGFQHCEGLLFVDGLDNVSVIQANTFSYCTNLQSLVISYNATAIGQSAFEGCTGLTSITIPDSVTSIFGGAFSGCTGLTSITIPDSVTSIFGGTFSGCTGLTSITVAKENPVFHSDGNCLIETSGQILIEGCKNSLIPDDGSVTSIGANAFNGCTGLTSIVIPDSVTSIDSHAFYNCTGLISIVIPDSVTSIGHEAFSGCSGLTSVTIGSGVDSIGYSAFYGCSGLTSITIPDSVTHIDTLAFKGCTNLLSVYFANTNGWKKISNFQADDISPASLSDASTAAKYLTHNYSQCRWIRY